MAIIGSVVDIIKGIKDITRIKVQIAWNIDKLRYTTTHTLTTFASEKFCLIELNAYITGVWKYNNEETSAEIALSLQAVDVCINTNTDVWGIPPITRKVMCFIVRWNILG